MQFLLYLIVGGLSFFVDIGIFVLLRMAEMPVIPASIVSFIAATGANYALSTILAFQGGRFRRHIELVRFLIVVLIGLALNTALVWLFAYPFGIEPTLAKIIAVPMVLVWNYLGRRLLVFHDRLPTPILKRLSLVRRRRRAAVATRVADTGKPAVEKPPIDLTRQPHQRASGWPRSMMSSSAGRNRSF